MRTAKIALGSSFLLWTVAGCSFIVIYCIDAKNDILTAVSRATLFMTMMAGVHWLCYREWVRQLSTTIASTTVQKSPVRRPNLLKWRWDDLPRVFRRALTWAIVQQLLTLPVSAMLLDFGTSFRCWSIAAIAYWMVAILITHFPDDFPQFGMRFAPDP